MRSVFGSEFQTDEAENRKARLEKSVLVNGWSSSGMEDELVCRRVLRFGGVSLVYRSGRTANFVRQNWR